MSEACALTTSTPISLHPPQLQTPALLSAMRHMSPYSTPPPLVDVTNLPVHFTLKSLQGTTIRSSYGCSGAIRVNTVSVPPPPHDMVIRFRERQYYKDPFTRELNYTAAEENTHYHFPLSCIQKKQSSFEPAKLVTPRDISLTFVHVACLLDEFGIRVWQYCKTFTCTISTLSLHW